MDAEKSKELKNTEAEMGFGHPLDDNHQEPDLGFKLIDRIEQSAEVVVRDDQYDFFWLEEAARRSCREGKRFSLIDTGVFPQEKVEWLAEAGADIYSSDNAQRDFTQLAFIAQAAKRGRRILAYFYRGALISDDSEAAIQNLCNLGARGAFIHLANRKKEELALLTNLGVECHRGGSWLVYYHQGPLEEELASLADTGAWLHLSSQQIKEEDTRFLLELVKLSQSHGGNVVLYVENELSVIFLRDMIKAKAFLIFPQQLYDYRSPYRPFQDLARQMKLDFRAYYLYPRLLGSGLAI